MMPSIGSQNQYDYQSPPAEPTFHEYLAIIFRGKWIILVTFLSIFASTLLFTFLQSPTYESTAVVLVNTEGKQSTLPIFDITGGVKNIKNELEILKSRSLAQTVAQRLLERIYLDESRKDPILIIQKKISGLERLSGIQVDQESPPYADIDEILKRMEKVVSFDPVRESDVIKITVESTDPREAALIANTFAEAYYERNLLMSRTKSRAAREFLEAQVKDKRRHLDEAEVSLQKYMEVKGIVALDEEAKKTIDQLAELEAARDGVEIELQTISNTLVAYREVLAQQEIDVAKAIGEASDPYIRLLQEQIAQLEVQRDVTIAQNPSYVGRAIYTQKLKEIDEQIAALRQKLQKRTEKFLQSVVPSQVGTSQGNDPAAYLRQVKHQILEAQIQMQALQAKKKALAGVIRQYERNFERIPQKSIQYARLQRTRLSGEKIYLLVEEKYNEAIIAEQSEFGYVDIIDPAIIPLKPVSPKIVLNLVLGAFVGLCLGFGIVFVRERFDVKIQTPEDLKKHGHIFLSAIMLMDDELERLGTKTKISVDGKELDAHLLAYSNPLSSIAEGFRRLRTNVQYSRIDQPVRTILITSPNPMEGKSTIVSNLAIAYAQTGKKVLLIDTDLRRPNLHNEFDLKREPGLCDILRDGTITKNGEPTPVENLYLMTCGEVPANPAEVLGSQRMREFVEKAKEDYEVILFDSSPVLAVTDSSILTTLVDGVITVVSAGKTRMNDLERTIEQLTGVGGRPLGIVLNNFDVRSAYGGYYGYYAYGGYRYYGHGYGYGNDGRHGGSEKKRTDKESRISN